MEIKCPKCNNFFDLSEDIADRIREQIRTKEFEKELNARLTDAKKNYDVQRENAVSEAIIAEREKSEKLLEAERIKAEKLQLDFAELKAQAEAAEKNHESSIRLAKIESAQEERLKYEKILSEAKNEADSLKDEAQKARNDLALAVKQSEIDIQQAIIDTKSEYDKKIASLNSDKENAERERDFYKDFKARQSTKMIGESLEQHCEIEFNKIRMAAFPNAEFGKDNLVSKSGSKGDYIFREYDENDVEIISIMFEMKNEADTTSTKKTNDHFLKELDKDRREKKCEYAILVSLLESDNDYYNQGIVDMSYKYEKMYVIRPQFFIPLITLLRNAALTNLSAKQELFRMQQQDIDLQNFEAAFADFKDKFGYNYNQAAKRFDEAISEIDKTIEHLNKVKESLLKSGNQLRLANEKVDNVSVRKLTKNSPSIRAMLDEK